MTSDQFDLAVIRQIAKKIKK